MHAAEGFFLNLLYLKISPIVEKSFSGCSYQLLKILLPLTSLEDVNVADVLMEFLEVLINTVLYVRNIYPDGIFKKYQKYNMAVMVSKSAVYYRFGFLDLLFISL